MTEEPLSPHDTIGQLLKRIHDQQGLYHNFGENSLPEHVKCAEIQTIADKPAKEQTRYFKDEFDVFPFVATPLMILNLAIRQETTCERGDLEDEFYPEFGALRDMFDISVLGEAGVKEDYEMAEKASEPFKDATAK